uniref:Signal transduction histidine kinase n=1 Tax=Paulinella longichromatophora TaxID=1708747 RepID=A0A2H4ZQ08_9EUKA|nr:hypothetical protein PLO_605 [Paulinella longichromatophora]
MSSLTFAYIRQQLAHNIPPGNGDEESVWRQWKAALVTLQENFLTSPKPKEGIWLAATLPDFDYTTALTELHGCVWQTPERSNLLNDNNVSYLSFPLNEQDGSDPFLVLITPHLQISLAIYGPPNHRQLLVCTAPDTLKSILLYLGERIYIDSPNHGKRFCELLKSMFPLHNKQDLAYLFWSQLAQRLAQEAPKILVESINTGSKERQNKFNNIVSLETHESELALIEALSHEVRTPLATIRTLIRSLLRRSDITTTTRQRLIQIDGECSEQIDRFGLIFHAAELQRQPEGLQQLARTNLGQLLLHLKPIWQQQLERRGLQLVISITPELPEILSDSSRLATMLGGLVAHYSRDLNSTHTIRLSLTPAGTRLRLQLGFGSQSGSIDQTNRKLHNKQSCLNPVLTWNPTTGSLQLSEEATQKLFHSLGGQVSEGSGDSLVVFFPLAEEIC